MSDRPAGGPTRAIVLAGGGARGAYEAGVLCYLLEELPRRLGHPIGFDLLLGTSVGAIHACFLAAAADLEDRAVRLRRTWEAMRFERLFRVSRREALRLPQRILGFLRSSRELEGEEPPTKLYGLLDPAGFERLVVDGIPWSGIRRNLQAGLVRAVAVTATEIATGRAVVFVEGDGSEAPSWRHDPGVVPRAARLGPLHVLASAAIPVMFPAVRIEDGYYADGSLRLNTPLAPAVHLGADRILVVALRPDLKGRAAAAGRAQVAGYGNPVSLYGKLLNALLLDHLDADLGRMRLVNSILRTGADAFGEGFVPDLNAAFVGRGGHVLRVIDDLVIRPSEDLGRIAAEMRRSRAGLGGSALARLLMRSVESSGRPGEADLLSYFLFDARYIGELLRLGYCDARACEEELAAFFSDGPPSRTHARTA